jgi:amidase
MANGATLRLEPSQYWYTFGPNPPALHVEAGASVTARTRDARGLNEEMQPLPDAMKQRSQSTVYRESNPLVGPIFVEGAEVGDTLVVHVRRIRLNRPYAWSRFMERFGSFTGEGPGRSLLLNAPLEERLFDWQLDLERMVGVLDLPQSRLARAEIPLRPFLGCIGVAPRFGRVEMSLSPGEYGGNMDYPDVTEGTTIYLPVWVDGAYLALGDVHAAQGDGEICGVALETTAEVVLEIDVEKGKAISWPRLDDGEHIAVLGSTRPLEDCIRLAHLELLSWLEEDYGFDRWEAFQLMSQVGSMHVGNVVDPNYTVGAKFPKRFLP